MIPHSFGVIKSAFSTMKMVMLDFEHNDIWVVFDGGNPWCPIISAPRDGTIIEVCNSRGERPWLAMWSERPVCMGGPTVYNKPGWVTTPDDKCESNLPLDTPVWWRRYNP